MAAAHANFGLFGAVLGHIIPYHGPFFFIAVKSPILILQRQGRRVEDDKESRRTPSKTASYFL